MLLVQWGVASPSHFACRSHSPVALHGPFLAVSRCDGSTPRFAEPVLRVNDVQVRRHAAPPRGRAAAAAAHRRAALQPAWYALLTLSPLQVLGTHNSYHLQPWPVVFARAWRYTHTSLTAQLDAGARCALLLACLRASQLLIAHASPRVPLCSSLELDVHWDAAMHTFAVYHEPFVDPRSSCGCLASCLRSVAAWSAAHPGHALLKLVFEPKYNIDVSNPFRHGATAALRALQATVLRELPAAALLTPAAVQGDAPSLRAAVIGAPNATCGWPSARETRSAFMLVLDVW